MWATAISSPAVLRPELKQAVYRSATPFSAVANSRASSTARSSMAALGIRNHFRYRFAHLHRCHQRPRIRVRVAAARSGAARRQLAVPRQPLHAVAQRYRRDRLDSDRGYNLLKAYTLQTNSIRPGSGALNERGSVGQ